MKTTNYRGKVRFTYTDEGELTHISCYDGEFDVGDKVEEGRYSTRACTLRRKMGDYYFGFNRDGSLVYVWKDGEGPYR